MNKESIHITDDLIVAFLNGETTKEQYVMIQNWIEESLANKKHVEDIKTIWIEAGKLDPQPVVVNVDKAWDSLSARIEKVDNLPLEKKTIPLYKTFLKIAAVLVPVLFISYFYFHTENEKKQLAIITNNSTITKKLIDGSEVTINANSKFKYPEQFTESTREGSLNGEAFFSIAPNKAKPFIIHSDDVSIKVIGTSFNVKTSKECVEVLVKTGKVLLYSVLKTTGDTVSEILIPGDKGIYYRSTNKVTKEQSNENDLFWMTKNIEFNKTDLLEVIAIIEKNYGISIKLKNQKLSNLRLTASFSNQPIESIFEIIESSLNVTITKTTKSYEIDENDN